MLNRKILMIMNKAGKVYNSFEIADEKYAQYIAKL